MDMAFRHGEVFVAYQGDGSVPVIDIPDKRHERARPRGQNAPGRAFKLIFRRIHNKASPAVFGTWAIEIPAYAQVPGFRGTNNFNGGVSSYHPRCAIAKPIEQFDTYPQVSASRG
jgi:hypothetical protein